MDEKTLGKRLQLARKRAGLTQQELCQKAGLSYSTLAKIERGAIKAPSVFTVAHIALVTGVSVEDLLEMGSGSPAPANSKKRSKSGVTFVYFDVNGTLVRYYHRAFTEIANLSETSVEIVESIFLHYDGAACRGLMKNEEVDKAIAAEIGMPDFSWQRYYLSNVEATPGAAELLSWAAENYDVGLLTNNWLGFTEEMLQKGIIPRLNYAAVVESAKSGCFKPEAKIYELAQQLTGVPSNEILLVDDNPAYIAGAEKAGWQTEIFDENNPAGSIARIKQSLSF
jgi:FMN phosphatase YigB (HAD superfamily)/DNA-binding XRE family transcriptional regulator